MELKTISSFSNNGLICGLCDTNIGDKWQCLQCSINMCDLCKTIHSSTKSSVTHDITCIGLESEIWDSELKKQIQMLHCKKHPTEFYSRSCKTCDFKLVCNNCLLCDHIGHNITHLDQIINRQNHDLGYTPNDNLPRGFMAQYSNENSNVILYTSEFRLIHKVVTDIPVIEDIKAVNYLSAWCGGIEIHKLKIPIKSRKFCVKYIYNKMNKNIKSNLLDEINGFNALDMVINGEELWFVSKHDSNLKRMFQDNYKQRNITNIIDFEEFEPTSIHLDTKNNLFWVGLKESGPEEFGQSQVGKLTAFDFDTWKPQIEFERSTNGKRLFTVPKKLHSINNQIVVIDKTCQKMGRVVSLDYQGHRKWQYCEVHGHGLLKPFYPTSLAITADDKIVLTDIANNCIHILNYSGQFIAFKLTTDFDLKHPNSLDIDEHGSLWIGSGSNQESEIKSAKICVVRMTIK